MLGDSVTTDHISPAGSIPAWSPAGQWLQARGVAPLDFNSYGARRGHHEVMMRGTFGNIRLRNALAEGKEGPYTDAPAGGEEAFIYDAAMRYQAAGVPAHRAGRHASTARGSLPRLGGQGHARCSGSGPCIAESFERIHRSNLVGMGVLPLQFLPGESAAALGLTGRERYTIAGLGDDLAPRARLTVVAAADAADGGGERRFAVDCRLDGPIEVDYYRQGGILPAVLRRIARESGAYLTPGRLQAPRAPSSGPPGPRRGAGCRRRPSASRRSGRRRSARRRRRAHRPGRARARTPAAPPRGGG